MRAHWTSVDAEEGDRHESPVAAETQDSIAQFKGSMMLFGIVLMKVDVYTAGTAQRRQTLEG
jgi:hypothetical protein